MFEKTKINVKEAEEVPFSKKRKHVFWQRSSFSGKIGMLKIGGFPVLVMFIFVLFTSQITCKLKSVDVVFGI